MSLLAVVSALTVTVVALGALVLLLRHQAYRRRLCDDPGQNCVLGMVGPEIETISVRCDDSVLILPEPVVGEESAFLEVKLRASVAGRVSEPAVEIRAGDFRDVQYFERGVQGVRFLNLSRIFRSKAGKRVHLSGRGVRWEPERARLYICREQVTADDRVLVIAPHPDDAEIAAFGLYADTRSTW